MERNRFQTTKEKLEHLAGQAVEHAQSSNDSAAPELLDNLDCLLMRYGEWQAKAKGCSARERRRLIREAEALAFDFRTLPLSLEDMPLEQAR